ncbi:hypothetical protein GWO63_010265 [Corynebacterium macginleyi]|uniref:Uncharacterized protein n=1 Tax=Corynebacterium macginleyi TaxID=38290 RepID=A0ABS1Y8B2_9CORY|nr:hypothetical protein [Corynebacterium macginleyi]MBM0244612.1 hypothetical protein [Corynebacterium macginleyi]
MADSAQVTVLRSLASTAFGKYNLTLPEGVDLEDVYEVAAPGNELAYVSSLGPRKRVGGMFRRFVRADVDITAKGEGTTPASNVERVLDEAAQRTSGDFFLESDISLAGLGPWRPFEDFVVGDVANVDIWGRVVPLRVTRIEPKRTEHSDTDWAVHVGGQLVSDADARLAENADIYKAVVDDRRDLAGLDAKIQAETSNRKQAISAESSARRADVESVRSVLTGGGEQQRDLLASLEGLNRQLKRNGEDPAPGLIPAYLQMNTQLWRVQQETNEALRRSDEALREGQKANTNLIRTNSARQQEIQQNQARLNAQSQRLSGVIADVQRRQPQFIAFGSRGGVNALGTIQVRRGNIYFDKLGSWSGTVAIFAWVEALISYPVSAQISLGVQETGKEFRVGVFESVKAGLAIIVPD